jgi:hypothetical protein
MAFMTVHGRIAAAALALACLYQIDALAQRGGSNKFTDPSGRYSIEFPRGWDWTIVEGAGEPLSTFVHPKKEAAIVVERFRMEVPLTQSQITEAFAQFETETLKENQPRASEVNARVVMQGDKRLVQIDYRRPGIGEPGKVEDERVRQFSFPVGASNYRITCFSLLSQFGKYEAIFQWAAESLTPGEALTKK